jgi:hypothetical protein
MRVGGVAPANSLTGYTSIELGQKGQGLFGGYNDSYWLHGAYYNGGFKYGDVTLPVAISANAGNLLFYMAPSGSPDAPLTWSEKMRLTAGNNNLLIGGTTDISGSGGLKVFGTTASTSTSTGALVVGGGVGVAGAINAGGNIKSSVSASGASGGVLLAENTAAAATGNQASVFFPTSTGASTYWQLIGRQNSATANDQTLRVVFGGVAQHTYFNASDLSVQSGITLKVLATTASTSTSSGALVVSGGVGVAKSINAGEGGSTHNFTGGDGGSGSTIFTIKDYAGTTKVNVDGIGGVGIGASLVLSGSSNVFRISNAQTPASATATGTAGTIAWDTSYIYVCTATNTWKRVAISTW